MANPPNWLHDEVLTGLQRFYALRLKNSPPADATLATAAVWTDAINDHPIAWDESLDRKRIELAFRKLCSNIIEWPAPRQLIELIPRRPEQAKLPAPQMSPEQIALNKLRLAEILAGLKNQFSTSKGGIK